MPFAIHRHTPDLIWVELHGHVGVEHAEAYYREMWQTLDACTPPTDLLIDGRRVESVSPSARNRTDQVVHHPHLGHVAFVVGGHHLLLFAPLVKLVSGVGLFSSEREALRFLHESHGHGRADLGRHAPPPARHTGMFGSLNRMVDGWTRQVNAISRNIEGD